MNAVKRRVLSALLSLAAAQLAHGQTFTFSKTVIDPNPAGSNKNLSFEKVPDYFTATSHPSYFLGSQVGASLYDTTTGQKIIISTTGRHYERAKSFLYPGDTYPGVIASVDTSLVWYQNPANSNGGNAAAAWNKFVINPNSGCHDLQIADIDGDGKQDIVCSATSTTGRPNNFVAFQNNYNNWTIVPNFNPSGDSIDLFSVSGVNGGARTNIVACNPSNSNLYWYQNPGGSAARNPANWTASLIGGCNEGVTIAGLDVGGRSIVVVASNEIEPTAWAPGLVYYDPGTTPNSPWTQHTIDSSYRDVHQITTGVLSGVRYITVGEQEQASSACNTTQHDDHPTIPACRVAIFPWTGSGFGTPTILSNYGTQNQQVLLVGTTAYMVGANHDNYGAVDPAYNLWQVQVSGGGASPLSDGTYYFTLGSETLDGGFGFFNQSPAVQFYPTAAGNTHQQWAWNGTTLLNAGWPNHYMTDGNNGTVSESTSADSWSIANVAGGFTLRNNRTGNYVANNSGTLAMAASPATFVATIPSGSLPTGTYYFTLGSAALDGGFGFFNQSPAVQFYPTAPGNTHQQWTWNGSTLLNVGWSNPAHYMTDGNDGSVSESTTVDTWTISSVAGGYSFKNNRTGKYVANANGTLVMASSPTALAATP